MKSTKETIKDMEKEFDEKFRDMKDSWNVDVVGYDVTKQDIKSFYLKHIRTLLESFGEEIIKTRYKCGWRHDEEGAEYDLCDECRAVDEYKAEQRLKVKEIISSVSK